MMIYHITRSQLVLTILVTFSIAPTLTQAGQLAPNPNPDGNTITVTGDDTNDLVFSNAGEIDVNAGASLTNSNGASLDNASIGTITISDGARLNNNGVIMNSGTVNTSVADIRSADSGVFFNAMNGSFTNTGVVTGNFFSNSELNNMGTVDVREGTLFLTGSVINSGELSVGVSIAGFTGTSHAGLQGSMDGIITNTSSGVVTFLNTEVVGIADIILNDGAINFVSTNGVATTYTSNQSTSTLLTNNGSLSLEGKDTSFYSSGTLVNTGTLTNNGSLIYDTDASSFASASIPMIVNSGTVINNNNFSGRETYIQEAGTTTNNGSFDFTSSSFIINGGEFLNQGAGVAINEGTFTVGSGASLVNDSNITITSAGGGRLNNSGSLINNGDISLDETTVYTQSAGNLINKGSLTAGGININGGSVSGSGSFTGPFTLGAAGSINPGNSPGTLTINGDFNSFGTLIFEFAGLVSGEFDVLDINGNASFTGGSLQFNFIDGFLGSAGDSFDFLLADAIVGLEDLDFSITGLGRGLDLSLINNGNSATLQIISTANAVPEPGTILLFAAGILGIAYVRRRRLM